MMNLYYKFNLLTAHCKNTCLWAASVHFKQLEKNKCVKMTLGEECAKLNQALFCEKMAEHTVVRFVKILLLSEPFSRYP